MEDIPDDDRVKIFLRKNAKSCVFGVAAGAQSEAVHVQECLSSDTCTVRLKKDSCLPSCVTDSVSR